MKAQVTFRAESGKVIQSVVDIPASLAKVTPADEQYRRIQEYINDNYDVDIVELLDAAAL